MRGKPSRPQKTQALKIAPSRICAQRKRSSIVRKEICRNAPMAQHGMTQRAQRKERAGRLRFPKAATKRISGPRVLLMDHQSVLTYE